MPTVQVRNPSMQQLNSADALDVEDNNFGGEWYDHAGGQSFMLGNPLFVLNFDTEKINSAPTIFSMASDILTIAEAGLYLFSYQVMISAGGQAVAHAILEQDPATGTFAVSLPAVVYFPTAGAGLAGVSTGTVTALIQVGINYRYRVRVEQSHGSTPMLTVADGSKLSVVRLFKNG